MKEFINSIREKKLPKKTIVMIVGAVVVLIGLLLSEFTTGENKTPEEPYVSSEEYIKSTEKNLEKLLIPELEQYAERVRKLGIETKTY